MALKDLVAEKGALDEAVIERIVGPYARFDLDAKEIHFMPAFAALSIKLKILVFLVALQGWRFVSDAPMPSDARPSEIESATGIVGGSLRPALRSLSENHLVAERDSRYSVRGANFAQIEAELGGDGETVVIRRPRRAGRNAARSTGVREDVAGMISVASEASSIDEEESTTSDARRSPKAGSKTGNLAATFERWIDEGYFDESRTLSEVQKRFRKEAIMVPQTSLPGYFLGAVRKGRLTREESAVNGKTVWAYKSAATEKAKAK